MTDDEQKICLNLKLFYGECKIKMIPLKIGNNLILSKFFPFNFQDNLILFNINITNHYQGYLRSFDHFPLIIKTSEFSREEISLEKQSIINLNSNYSIFQIQICPILFKNFYFTFEGVKQLYELRQELEKEENIFKNQNNEDILSLSNQKYADVNEKIHNKVDEHVVPIQKDLFSNNENFEDRILVTEKSNLEIETKKICDNGPLQIEPNFDKESKDKINTDILIKQNEILIKNEDLIKPRKNNIIIDDDDISNPNKSNIINLKNINSSIKVSESNNKISFSQPEISRTEIINSLSEEQLPLLTPETPNKKLQSTKRITRSSSVKRTNEEEIRLLDKKRKRCIKYKMTVTKQEESVQKDNIIIENETRNTGIYVETSANKRGLGREIVYPKCTICLDTIKNSSSLDGCEHEFCKECIDQWALLSNECPLCKNEFKKISYWNSNIKHEKKVKKRRFIFEEEDDELWYNNCDENCMVCKKSSDEHLLLVCDRCMFSICHTYCAGLDLIPDEDWICANCKDDQNRISSTPRRRLRNNFQRNNLQTPIPKIESNVLCRSSNDKLNISLTHKKSAKKDEETKNINIPISCKFDNNMNKRNSLNFNVNVNLQITNTQKQSKKRKNIHVIGKSKKNIRIIQTRKMKNIYNLRKKKY